MTCKPKKLFNPQGDDSKQSLLCGDTTNILDLSNVKYPFFIDIVDTKMYPNNWLPQEVSPMDEDKRQFNKVLSDEEKEVYKNIISFLIYLDSIQTNNLPNIAEHVTLPEVVYFLTRQAYEEAIHSRSYGYIGINVLDKEELQDMVYRWRDNELLLERNKYIASLYEENKDNYTDIGFLKLAIANYLLEGLYFYNGFQFFHTLASRNLMIGTDIQIKYIQRDENLHCVGFRELIKLYKNEGYTWDEDLIYSMFEEAVKWDLKFNKEIIGDKILGMNNVSIEEYTYYLANKRLKDIGLDQTFPKSKNPYIHLDKIAAIDDEASNRANNFEIKSITYKDASILNGWDEI